MNFSPIAKITIIKVHGYIHFFQIEGLEYSYPTIRSPFYLIYSVGMSVIIKFISYNIYYMAAYMIEIIHRLIGRYYNFQPLLMKADVSILLM